MLNLTFKPKLPLRRVTADQLRQVRDAWHMTQTELACQLGVAPATVSRWEARGRANLPGWLAYSLMGLNLDVEASLANLDSQRP